VLTGFPAAKGQFKDSYVFEFLSLPDDYKENDLRKALVSHLKRFLNELGPDFSMIGEEYPLQVGMKDFRIDLLMFHRGLNCMVAIELKTTEFEPAHFGQLQFYLEALDRDVKKPHENPSMGILVCKTKDDEVVKYAMNRNMSPTMIAEYETKLINKSLLQKKLHELSLSFEKIDEREMA
jgi:RecB family endonuclease NucS